MANNCYYEMKVQGKKSDCEEWLKRMRSYEEPNHFWRIFSSDVYEECGDNEDYYIKICGDCAWSLESCCRTSGYSGGVDLFAVNTKELNLRMEAYSQEEGFGFQEHYIYDKGECLAAECEDWTSIYYDSPEFPSFEDFKAEFDIPECIEEADLNDGYYESGGFVWWG